MHTGSIEIPRGVETYALCVAKVIGAWRTEIFRQEARIHLVYNVTLVAAQEANIIELKESRTTKQLRNVPNER